MKHNIRPTNEPGCGRPGNREKEVKMPAAGFRSVAGAARVPAAAPDGASPQAIATKTETHGVSALV